MNTPILYFDMDNVLVDFQTGIHATSAEILDLYANDGTGKPHYDDIPDIFSRMKPMEGAVKAVKELSEHFDCYILSTSPWGNPTALSDKLAWVKQYFDNTVPVVTIKEGGDQLRQPILQEGDFLAPQGPLPARGQLADRRQGGAWRQGLRRPPYPFRLR